MRIKFQNVSKLNEWNKKEIKVKGREGSIKKEREEKGRRADAELLRAGSVNADRYSKPVGTVAVQLGQALRVLFQKSKRSR